MKWKCDDRIYDCQVLFGKDEAKEFLYQYDLLFFTKIFLTLAFLPFVLLFEKRFLICYGLVLLYFTYQWKVKLKEDSNKKMASLRKELPDMLLKLWLSLKAGLIFEKAWRDVAFSQEGLVYEQMQEVLERQEMGLANKKTFLEFANRYPAPVLREIGELSANHLLLGGSELESQLYAIRKELLDKERRHLEVEADKASQNMLFPAMLIFLGILLLMFLPIFM